MRSSALSSYGLLRLDQNLWERRRDISDESNIQTLEVIKSIIYELSSVCHIHFEIELIIRNSNSFFYSIEKKELFEKELFNFTV